MILYQQCIEQAVTVLQQRGVIAYPTEYCFGLGCFSNNEEGLKRIRAMKKRPEELSFIVIGHDIDSIKPLTTSVDEATWQQLAHIWPAAITYLLPASKDLSSLLLGGNTEVALRIPDHSIARKLCALSGGTIVSTSANRRGEAPLRHYDEVCDQFGQEVDFVVDAPCGEYNKPSRLIRYRNQQVIRP